MIITGPRKTGPHLVLRRAFVWSSARPGAARAAREKKLGRARADPESLGRGLGGRYYQNPQQVSERLAVIAAKRRVKAYLVTEVGSDTAGPPTLSWHFGPAALDAEAATDGWYALSPT